MRKKREEIQCVLLKYLEVGFFFSRDYDTTKNSLLPLNFIKTLITNKQPLEND